MVDTELQDIWASISSVVDAPWCQKEEALDGITNVYSALHKSGSMWLHQNLLGLCYLASKDYYLPNVCHDDSGYCDPTSSMRSRVPPKMYLMGKNISIADIAPGSCLGPVRNFETWIPLIEKHPTYPIVHVFNMRNPLDMLVSAYYSFGWTHATRNNSRFGLNPEIREMGIDEYVVQELPDLRERITKLYQTLQTSCCTLGSDPKCKYFCVAVTYEESMLSYATWLEKISKTLSCNKDAQVGITSMIFQKESSVVQGIMTRDVEANKGHVRSGVPGNYAQHLSSSTIDLVRNELKDYFELLKLQLGGIEAEGFYALPKKTTWEK